MAEPDWIADSAPALEVPLPLEPPGETAIVSPPAGRPSRAAVTAPPMSTFTGSWLDQQTFAPVGWILPGIIPEGQTLLVAPPKAGKSWLVYALALARATGGRVLGQRISAGPVLYLALEDGHRRLQDRGRTLLAPGESLPESINYAIRTNPLTFIADLQRWIGERAGQRPLVIIDTLGKVKQPARSGGSQYEHDYAEMSMLKALVDDEPGAAMILVHHDRKAASDDFLDNVSGTHGLAGAADTTVVINRPRTGANGVLSVTGREVTEAEYAVTFDAGTWTLDGADLQTARQTVIDRRAAGNLGERSTEILKFVQAHPEGVRPRDVAQAFSIEGKEATKYLGRLEQSGRIDRPERGTYTPGVSGATGVTDGDAPTEVPEPDTPRTPVTPQLHSGEAPRAVHPCGHPVGKTPGCLTCLMAERGSGAA